MSVHRGSINQSNHNVYARQEPSLRHLLMILSHKLCKLYFHKFFNQFCAKLLARTIKYDDFNLTLKGL